MRIDILTVVPELLASPLNESILKRAQEKGLVEIHIHNIRDYTEDKHRTTDDYPFGGEAGMVMKIEPIYRCIEALKAEREYDEVIYTSPDGIRYDQHEANRLSTLDNLIILCGHYKGIDYRIREHLVTREISIGDYVLTGGELAACIIADSVVRLIPGAIGDEASALTDSFQDNLLAPVLGIDDPRTDPRIDFVGGVRGLSALEDAVDGEDATVAFSLYPTSMDQLMTVADKGLVMPPKSTWFEPKLRDALTVHMIGDEQDGKNL